MSEPELPKPIHLGDGAYASCNDFSLIITANHHNPIMATDAVYIEFSDMRELQQYITKIIEWLDAPTKWEQDDE